LEAEHNKIDHKIYSNAGNEAVFSLIEGKNLSILDVGCGAGDNAKVLIREGHRVDGITLSETEATTCRKFMENVFVHNLEFGLPTNMDKKYDYIICSHVLEHIVYPKAVLSDLKNMLKFEGKLIVALPNIMHYKSRIQLLIGNFNYEESGIWDFTHVKWYTFSSGKALLEENGFLIESAFVDGDIPLLSIFGKIPFKLRKKIYKILVGISKGFFGGQLIYVSTINKNYLEEYKT
jgi:cyclopropane fatty-acyl-phospholipid synthase-like methyltransferase